MHRAISPLANGHAARWSKGGVLAMPKGSSDQGLGAICAKEFHGVCERA
jgi:hypothetical protein